MNNKRRDRLRRVLLSLRRAVDDMEYIRDDEQDSLDNLPENLAGSERGERMYDNINYLDDAIMGVELAIEKIGEVFA